LLIIYLIIYYFLLFIQKNLPKKIAIRKLETFSEITITIKGKGKISILSESFSPKPIELFINGEKQSKINNYVNNLNDEINIIIMKWNQPLKSCDSMFLGLTNIIKFDFSKFDTSKVEKMDSMFFECSSLMSLDLNGFNTSSVTSMSSMFCTCSSLKTLDLSSFNTSLVRDMSNMFSECTSLISINLNNFNTSSLINIYSMFSGCSSLISLDLSNFDTPIVD
jgi:surface protein